MNRSRLRDQIIKLSKTKLSAFAHGWETTSRNSEHGLKNGRQKVPSLTPFAGSGFSALQLMVSI